MADRILTRSITEIHRINDHLSPTNNKTNALDVILSAAPKKLEARQSLRNLKHNRKTGMRK